MQRKALEYLTKGMLFIVGLFQEYRGIVIDESTDLFKPLNSRLLMSFYLLYSYI